LAGDVSEQVDPSFDDPGKSLTRDLAVTHHEADVGDVRLHYASAGDGPLVVLLHGFPEFWYAWRHQIPALARAGYRAVAPDLRGYNFSGKPRGVHAYRIPALVEDVAGLIRACGASRATVVGHDWGGLVAWAFAMQHPELLDRLVVLNSPHPKSMARAIRTRQQLLKSWYVFFFQLPWVPEVALRSGGFAALVRDLQRDPVVPGVFGPSDLGRYATAWAQPGALTAMLNYYRALGRTGVGVTRRPILAPVLVIWSERDRYLGRELADPDPDLVPNARVERIDASHWVQNEQPERVNELMLGFLRRS
jgi:pimeloyl-ACP methyl ester carboxylesterase